MAIRNVTLERAGVGLGAAVIVFPTFPRSRVTASCDIPVEAKHLAKTSTSGFDLGRIGYTHNPSADMCGKGAVTTDALWCASRCGYCWMQFGIKFSAIFDCSTHSGQ
jgi:hypothetical protein